MHLSARSVARMLWNDLCLLNKGKRKIYYCIETLRVSCVGTECRVQTFLCGQQRNIHHNKIVTQTRDKSSVVHAVGFFCNATAFLGTGSHDGVMMPQQRNPNARSHGPSGLVTMTTSRSQQLNECRAESSRPRKKLVESPSLALRTTSLTWDTGPRYS